MSKKPRPSVVYLLKDLENAELREQLEQQFIAYECTKKLNVEAQRAALRAQANAFKTAAEVQLSQLDFLIKASAGFDMINTEPIWMIRRRADGEIALECLLTEHDMQRMAKAQTKQMKEHINEITGDDDDDEDESSSAMFKDDK